MPTYVYECKSCHAVFEADQSIKDDPLDTCRVCEAVGTIKRVIQPVGIAFKGSGFHINDYSSSSRNDEPKAEPTKDESSKPDAPTTEAPKADIPKTESSEPAAAKPAETAKPSSELAGS
jgi:putative FmdB family regulatory protein